MESKEKKEPTSEDKEEEKKTLSAINHLSTVPTEILNTMMQFFGPQDLVNINRVSKNLFTLSNDENLWKTYGYANKEAYVKSVEEFMSKISQLKENKGDIRIALLSLDSKPMMTMKTNFYSKLAQGGEIAGIHQVKHEVGGFKFALDDAASTARFATVTNQIVAKSNILLVFVKDDAELNKARQNFEQKSRSKKTGLPLVFYVVDKNSEINFAATPTSQIIKTEIKDGKVVNAKEVMADLKERIEQMMKISESKEEKRKETKGFFK